MVCDKFTGFSYSRILSATLEMNVKEENVCRLCLNLVENEFEVIDVITREMLEALLLKVNLDVSKNPVICQQCGEIVKKSYYFKSLYTDTEKNIFSIAVDEQKVKFEFENVLYKDYEDVETIIEKDCSTCRFCMNQPDRNNYVSMDSFLKEEMFMDMLPLFMPDLDWNITKNTVVCIPCRGYLERYFKFLINSLDVEEKINIYCRNEATYNMGPVKLNDVRNFFTNHTSEYPDKYNEIRAIKQEAIFETTEDVYCEENVGQEDINIKDENENFFIRPPEIIEKYSQVYIQEGMQSEKTWRNPRRTEKKMYTCAFCIYKTKRKNRLKSHTLKHKNSTNVAAYKCTVCTYETIIKHNLYLHMLIHKKPWEVEMHKCTICVYETKRKDSLKEHINLIHRDPSEIKMYKCTICKYQSKRRRHLKRHMVIHKDKWEVDMYKCAKCTYETKHKDNLKKHTQKHKGSAGEKVRNSGIYTCETARNGDSKSHKNVLERGMYKCTACPYEAKRKDVLNNHVLTQHQVDSEIKTHQCKMCVYEG